MMNALEIQKTLQKIVEITKIINSALDNNDIDIVLESLDERNQLIEALKSNEGNNQSQKLTRLLDEFNSLNKMCIQKLNENKNVLKEEFDSFQADKKATLRNQKTQKKYTNPYDNMLSSTFDLKK